jgi:hypothetical protein
MIKQIFFLFSMMAAAAIRMGSGDRVSITQTAPMSVNAGGEFQVEMAISKAGITGYGKAQTTLPAGFVAVDDGVRGALLRQDENVLKLIWMELPTTDLFTARYKVLVDPAMAPGDYSFTIRFAYLDGNEKRSVKGEPVTIKVLPPTEETLAQLKAEQERSQPKAMAPASSDNLNQLVSESGVGCTMITERKSETEQVVNLKIQKGSVMGFGKVEIPVCEGLIATNVTNEGGVFSINENKVKYVWTDMPETPVLNLTFKLLRSPSAGWLSACSIDGEFSYLDKDQSKKCKINVVNLNYVADDVYAQMEAARRAPEPAASNTTETQGSANNNAASAANPVPDASAAAAPESTGTATARTETVNTGTELAASPTQNQRSPESANGVSATSSQTTSPTPAQTPQETIAQNASQSSQSSETAASNTASNSEPERKIDVTKKGPAANASASGITFKVQVCATHRDVTAVAIKSIYKLSDEVMQEMHEGWFKFTVGGFSEYSEARNKRESLAPYNLPGPFVTAYNNGTRITVQEALMITRQNWVK